MTTYFQAKTSVSAAAVVVVVLLLHDAVVTVITKTPPLLFQGLYFGRWLQATTRLSPWRLYNSTHPAV
jgi:hypothetical protein